ncbi:hypothetical protein CQW23_26433 [Capsicum baccatum]|uniref:Retrovirus-related Pol polyprotein from transposon TNT 1-94-like beta-barrel domain-containing protein n=1 Tax=Capsicum baccatum TaxID=33114 RepID=A0A2G2VNV7_CAPBA|nr:hypothetical protein CQW23_26433 [Capsicum baccatum]
MGSLQAHEARLNRSTEKNEEKAFQVKDATTKYGENGPASRVRGRRGFCGSRSSGYGRYRERNDDHKQSNEQDSSCSNHMTSAKSLFKELDEKQKKTVHLGNTKEMQVEGKYTVGVDTSHDKVKMLDNVLFVPDLGYNLLSVGKLMIDGHSLWFDGDACVITNKKSGKKVRITMTPNKIFPLDVSNMENFSLAAVQIHQDEDGIFLPQRKYAKDLLIKFGLLNCKPVATPMNAGKKLQLNDGAEMDDATSFRSLVGGLIYLTHTRLDIAFSVGVISRFMQQPSKVHFGATKRVLRYIAGTMDYGIWYSQVSNFRLCRFTDSDYVGLLDDRQSISAHVFTLGSGNIISILVFLAPVPAFRRICKEKSTMGFQSAPYVVALFSSMLWMYYAFIKKNAILLVSINSFGCVVETIYISIFILYASKEARRQTVKLLVSLIGGLYTLIFLVTLFPLNGASRVQVAGWICVTVAVAVFAAPLSIVFQVVRTKSVEFMPFTLSFFLTLSAIMWFAYGLLLKDLCIAMLLYGMYRFVKPAAELEKKVPEHVINMVTVGNSEQIHPLNSEDMIKKPHDQEQNRESIASQVPMANDQENEEFPGGDLAQVNNFQSLQTPVLVVCAA